MNMQFVNINNMTIKIDDIKQIGLRSTYDHYVEVPIYRLVIVQRQSPSSFSKWNIIKNLINEYNQYQFTGVYNRITLEEYKRQNKKSEGGGPFFYGRTSEYTDLIIERYSDWSKIEFDNRVESKHVKTRYLYILTSQNDEIQFFDYQINVDKEYENLKTLLRNF